MKITRLDAVEVIDVAPVEVATIEVTPAPALPDPLTADWIVTARQAVADAQAHHVQVVANIATLQASLNALQSDLAAELSALNAMERAAPQLPESASQADLEALLAGMELSAGNQSARRNQADMLRRKIPLVEAVLKQAQALERPAREAMNDAEHSVWALWAERIDLAGLEKQLLQYRVALSAAGVGFRFRNWIDSLLISTRRDDELRAELAALLAIPGQEPVADDEPAIPAPTQPPMRLVVTDGQPVEQSLTALAQLHEQAAPVDPLLDGSHYLAATNAIYAARTMAKAA